MGLTLGVSLDEDMSPILTKTIIQGFIDLNGSKATFATIGGGTTCAIATRHRMKVTCGGHILGVPILNDTKTTAGTIAGETGQAAVDIVQVYGNIIHKGVAWPLYVTPDGGDRTLALDGGMRGVLYVDGAIFVQPGDVVYVQLAWAGSASTINCPRHNVINLNEDEGYLFYDSGTAATDFTNAKAGADLNEWLPIVGNQQKSEMTANTTRMPAPCGLMMKVRGNQRHVAIRGTSRSIGNKNWYTDPTLYHDSYISGGCIAKDTPFINLAVGSSIGANDEDSPTYTANRRWLEMGATIIFDEHLQNDLANDYSLSDIQRRLVLRANEARQQGQTIVGFTVDPYTTTSASGDWTLESTQTVADSDTSTKRTAMNAWLRGETSTLTGGNPSIRLQDCYDRVLDTAAVTEGTDKTLWKTATTYDTGTATGSSATTLVDSAKTWTPYALNDKYVVGLTAADAVTKAIITSNAPAALAITSTTLTVPSWSNGTHGNKAYTIYNTLTNDGIHASYYGNRLKQVYVENYLGGTTRSFALNDLPWFEYWIAHKQYMFTDTGCSVNVGNTDQINVWVGALNGLKMTGGGATSPTYSPTSTYGAAAFNGTTQFLTATTALASVTNKQHRCAQISVLECPDSNAAIRVLGHISNNASNARFKTYFETGGGASTGLPASASRVDEAGTTNTDNWPTAYAVGTYIVRIDYVDYQEGKQYGWINGTIKLDDTTAWAASKGLSVATDSQVVYYGKDTSGAGFLNCRVMFIGLIRNFEMTPATVASLNSLLSTVSNWMPSGF